MTIRENIETIIEKYFREEDEYYSRYRYDKNEKEYCMDDEVTNYFKTVGFEENRYKLSFLDGFSSCGYDNDFLAISWIDEEGDLDMETVLLECM